MNLAETILIKSLMTGFFLGVVLSLAGLLTWVERKQSALIQDRLGANRAWIELGSAWWAKPFNWLLRPINRLGLFHPVADMIKMFTKEDFLPRGADRFLHAFCPFVALVTALSALCVVPFGDTLTVVGRIIDLRIAGIDNGLLLLLALLSLGIYATMLAGFASPNNYASLGSMRAAAQTLSYEIPFILSAAAVAMSYQTLDLQQMVRAQSGVWGIFIQPVAFVIFLIAGLCATKRIPFDLPEAEAEIIGYYVEYSAMKFGMFFMADLTETVLVACLTTTFFLGGWQVPFLYAEGLRLPWGWLVPMAGWAVSLLKIASFFFKVIALNWLFMTIRWSLPRFRYDQLLRLGWKILTPLAALNIVVTAALLGMTGVRP